MIHGKSQVIAGQETPLTLILQGKKVSPKEAEWESSDRHTAFVEKDGILTAGDIKKEKTVTITATVTVDDQEIAFTVTIGAAVAGEEGTIDGLIALADSRMYYGKNHKQRNVQ